MTGCIEHDYTMAILWHALLVGVSQQEHVVVIGSLSLQQLIASVWGLWRVVFLENLETGEAAVFSLGALAHEVEAGVDLDSVGAVLENVLKVA